MSTEIKTDLDIIIAEYLNVLEGNQTVAQSIELVKLDMLQPAMLNLMTIGDKDVLGAILALGLFKTLELIEARREAA